MRIFQTSKVRTIIFCDNPTCQKPRLIYAINKNKKMLPSMDAYAEEISYAAPAPGPRHPSPPAACTAQVRDRTSSTTHRYQCGDPLFEDDLQDPDLRQLKETFFIREAQSCHDPVEADFFNTGGTAVRHCASILACVPSASRLPLPAAHLHYLLHQGRAEFEYICS